VNHKHPSHPYISTSLYPSFGIVLVVEVMAGTDERIYTYTIITTSSAKSVSFLHDRMPVILEPESKEMKMWLDPNQTWSSEVANILKPYEGELTWSAPSPPSTAFSLCIVLVAFLSVPSSCSAGPTVLFLNLIIFSHFCTSPLTLFCYMPHESNKQLPRQKRSRQSRRRLTIIHPPPRQRGK
jgi:hypothetical protein